MGILNYVKPTEEKRYAKAVGFILNYMELDIAEMRLSAWSFQNFWAILIVLNIFSCAIQMS